MEEDYDKIYGMSLGEYCEAHGIKISDLISKVEKDIEILKANFNKEYTGMIPTPLGDRIYEALDKKRKHLARLQDWSNA